MLAHRIIPTILMKKRMQVKGVGFKADRVVGNAMQAARVHGARSVDEILMLDVTATEEGREPDYAMIEQLTKSMHIPVTVGGGVMTIAHAKRLLMAGADKIAVGSDKANLIYQMSEAFGRQCVVVTVDCDNPFEAEKKCLQAQANGAGEIILQSINRDGTMTGYDLDMIKRGALSVSVPVVASGGCSGYEDMENALQAGADAVAAGALYLFTGSTPQKAAEYLNSRSVEVRCGVG